MEIPYGSKQHDKIKAAILERHRMAQRKVALRYAKWREAEDLFRTYQKDTDENKARKSLRDAGTPQYVTLYIPYSYAMILTIHTYLTSVFLSRAPIFQYTGRSGETQQQIQALEALIDYQVLVGKVVVPLYIWLLDFLKYGVGIVGNYWADETKTIGEIVVEPSTIMGVPLLGRQKEVIRSRVLPGYKGNRVYNIHPRDFMPDPRVSLMNFQEGEFVVTRSEVSWSSVRSNAKYFNLDALENRRANGFMDRETGSVDIELPDDGYEYVSRDKGFVELLDIVWRIVPSEWDLGDSKNVEKWTFTLAGRDVIIGARPLGAIHDLFPYSLQLYEPEAYGCNPRGMLEVTKELNLAMNYLINQHFYNVRKVLNDQFVVDPSRLVMHDFSDSAPGRLLRLRPEAYGTDVRTVVTQLPVVDITAGHLRDVQVIGELMQRTTGASDNIMGLLNAGGRKTATEVRTSSSFGVNRLRTLSEYNSALGWSPLSQMMVQNSQQYFTSEQVVRITGDLMATAPQFLKVTPEMISGFYDFVPVDGTMPVDRYAQANLWKEIIMGLSKIPQIGAQYDIGGIFAWMAQLAGLKNITQFKLKMAPDQALAAQAQAGNMVPTAPGQIPGTPDLQLGPLGDVGGPTI